MPRHNVGHFKSERARAHFLCAYQTAMAQLPPVSESTDVPTSFGSVRTRNLLPRGQVELWAAASHAMSGEYPAEIAPNGGGVLGWVDAGPGVSSQ